MWRQKTSWVFKMLRSGTLGFKKISFHLEYLRAFSRMTWSMSSNLRMKTSFLDVDIRCSNHLTLIKFKGRIHLRGRLLTDLILHRVMKRNCLYSIIANPEIWEILIWTYRSGKHRKNCSMHWTINTSRISIGRDILSNRPLSLSNLKPNYWD